MKVIERKSAPAIEFRSLRIASSDFVELVQKHAKPDHEFELVVGDFFSKSRIIFDDVGELFDNLPMISSPLRLKIGSVVLEIREHIAHLSFDEADRHVAEAMLNDLKSYKSWFNFLLSSWFVFPLVLGVVFLIDTYFEIDPTTLLGILFLSLLVVGFSSAYVDLNFLGPRVIYRARDNFFQRNSDRIVLALISAAIGLGIGKFDYLISLLGANKP